MNVVIRTDASRLIGTGHVVRCLAVAEALREKGATVHFICRLLEGHIVDQIKRLGYGLVALPAPTSGFQSEGGNDYASWLGVPWQKDAEQSIEAISALDSKPDWLIVDHYALDANWEQCLRGSVGRTLVVDDLADRKHECEVLLDQNLYKDADTRYSGKVPDRCQLLLGPRYALLREEFRRARVTLRERSGAVRRILVFFGGAHDPERTLATVETLGEIEPRDISVDVVIGAQQQNRDEIEAACRKHSFSCHVQTDRMAELMSAADLAIGAGGSAHWERCCLGLPCLTFALADNQRQLVHDSALAGLLYAPAADGHDRDLLARHLQACIENPLLLSALSQNATAAVDGRGIYRLLRTMGVFSISVRAAVGADCDRLFEWRNHPNVRGVSRNTAPLTPLSHKAWFESVLFDSKKVLLIGEFADEPVGVVRFDIVEDRAEVSIYMVPGCGGHGRGTELLLAAERWLSKSRPDVRYLCAEVLEGNFRSRRLFNSAAYHADVSTYCKRLQ